ncbi:MAG TPA: Arm DNA-binding domain-containing protein, partial [Allosphingosinicella sp.]|nr:Arm DNA-binding domain-containing protein [Allosphingosinicella sp.]
MARKIAFTPAALDEIRVPICDPETPGLSLQPLPSGKKRWQFRRRLPGSEAALKLKLGSYPAYSIADAREWARSLNEQ